jgi:hypothetical protein
MMSHLDCLNLRLSNERVRLSQSRTDAERTLRAVWVRQAEKEIDREMRFLGRAAADGELPDSGMTDDQLLAALGAA